MKQHRNPRPRVANPAAPDNTAQGAKRPAGHAADGDLRRSGATRLADDFSPGDALERLYADLVEVEALAHAAGEAVTLLPSVSSSKIRRRFARLYSLVTKTADQATATLTLGENLVAQLSGHVAARRAAAPAVVGGPTAADQPERRAR
jgi:hypothetical protein